MKTLKQRFDEKWIEDKKTGCWEWQAYKSNGYGRINVKENGRWTSKTAHRLAYQLYKGEDPGKLYVCHTCDNRGCVNPDCMFLGTHADNMQDMVGKGRQRGADGEQNARARLKTEDVVAIKKILQRFPRRYKGSDGYGIVKFLSDWFDVRVGNIADGTKWKHVKV